MTGTTALTGDDALLTAWAGYVDAIRAVPEDLSGIERERFLNQHVNGFADTVIESPVHTLAGIATKLKLVLLNKSIFPGYHAAILKGSAPVDDDLEDLNDRILWQSIQAVERMAGAVQPAGDTELQAAFSRWIEQERHVVSIAREVDDDTFDAAVDIASAIIREIAATPSMSVAGLAIKIYLDAHTRYGGSVGDAFAVALPEPSGMLSDALQRSMLADALSVLRLASPAPAPVPDHFAEAVEAMAETALVDIEAAAILKAGAKAAGVTVEQARRVWVTMASMVAGPVGVAA